MWGYPTLLISWVINIISWNNTHESKWKTSRTTPTKNSLSKYVSHNDLASPAIICVKHKISEISVQIILILIPYQQYQLVQIMKALEIKSKCLQRLTVIIVCEGRSVFRTLSNILWWSFYGKIINGQELLTISKESSKNLTECQIRL